MVNFLTFVNTTTDSTYPNPKLYISPSVPVNNTNTILKYPAAVLQAGTTMSDTTDAGQYFVIHDWPATPTAAGVPLYEPSTGLPLTAPLYHPATGGFLDSLGQTTQINGFTCYLAGSETFLPTPQTDQFRFISTGVTTGNIQKVNIVKPLDDTNTNFLVLAYYNSDGSVQLVESSDDFAAIPTALSIEWLVYVKKDNVPPYHKVINATPSEEVTDI
ncbi:hypothetical protein HNQ68_002497 [Pseudochrobactrum saccharolyticum]|uniref:Uncharacterized protein n=1 Tax=Pseudochrobactrum saccharolyticum TaxID=354352 RepID=A0A7W8EQZ0_9HYPH|nr:hypothetical protein [Pseudochrobactrum saccharolyticum]KAB0537672.1 hypothetical protein F7P81_13195 [Pseudochrobactrum saccharolyticum]MBB5091952.1 hypothetical protein [Pseudochrobactrum saccharolyticum]